MALTRRGKAVRVLLLLLLLAGAGAAGTWWWTRPAEQEVSAQAGQSGGRGRGGPGGRRRGGADGDPIAVATAKAEVRDVPVYLDALGTVQAFNTVNVRAMVDGPLVEVRFREGQDVRTGDVLARIDPRPYQAALDQAVAKKRQDEANLANARLDAGRYAKLAATAYTSAQQADTARAQVAQLEAQVAGDQAQIDTARTQLSYTTVTAPIDGRLGLRQVDIGNIVRPGDASPLTVITQLRPISVVFTLPQQSLPRVAAAMQDRKPEVLALMETAAGTQGEALDRGELSVLDNQVDATTGTIKLKATFPNATLRLWPGGFVNVRLLVDTKRDATVVPLSAVQRGPRGPYVYVVKPDNTATRRPVATAFEDDRISVVTDGVLPGDQVVTDGAGRLSEGAKVAVAGPDGVAPDAVPVQRERQAPGTAQRGSRRGAS